MQANAVARIVKAGAALLAVAGVAVTPDMQEQIVTGAMAVYGVVSLIQAKIGK